MQRRCRQGREGSGGEGRARKGRAREGGREGEERGGKGGRDGGRARELLPESGFPCTSAAGREGGKGVCLCVYVCGVKGMEGRGKMVCVCCL